jgi:hypothetical protein
MKTRGSATKVALVLVVLAGVMVTSVSAATAKPERGTPAEAKAMLDKAVEHFQKVGREHALADFTAGKAPFRDRDLYVFCVDAKRVVVANGGYPDHVGMSADERVDAQGTPLGKALWDAAAKSPNGSVSYPHTNPVTKKAENKVSFYGKVADDLLCGVGAYSAK